ncbi:MAG: response regulator [Planctomycetota bacterium]
MSSPRRRSPFARAGERRRARFAAGLLGAATLLASGFAFVAVSSAEEARERRGFEGAALAAEGRIQSRIQRQSSDLRAVSGLFTASEHVHRAEFRAFVENQRPTETQPGVRAVAYIQRVPRAELDAFVARARADGAPGFTVRSPGADAAAADDLFVTTYVEPMVGNEELLGLDVGSLRASRAALEAAEDRGRTTISGAVPGAPTPTVVFYRAIRVGPAPDAAPRPSPPTASPTPDAVGWVAAIVDVQGFLGDALATLAAGIDVEVFDTSPGGPPVLLYDADRHLGGPRDADRGGDLRERYRDRRHVRETVLTPGGRTWAVRSSALPSWSDGGETPLRWVVLGLGAVVSALVVLVVAAATRTRSLAQRLTERATGHLERQARELSAARDDAMAGARAKSDFIAAVSHEIRTPLNGVLGTSQLLLDAGLPVEPAEQVRTIRSSAQALLAILNDILDVSRMEAGKLELVDEPFDLREAVEEVLDLLVPTAAAKGVELVLRWAPDAPSTFVGDALRWKQVVLNLAGNAVKFTERGHVLVDARPGATPSGERGIELRVEDTGIGIPRDRIPALFRRFAQADPSSSRRHGGVGLGLLITRLLVERMGGAVDVTSEVGQGSTFRVVVPMPRGASTVTRVTRPPSSAAVLVVDDVAVARRVAVEAVAALGCAPAEATDAASARAALLAAAADGRPFAVALVDLGLPGEDGLALARRLRADPATADVRLVLVAPAARANLATAARDAGFDAWVGKPLRARDVADALAALAPGPRRADAPFLTHAVLADARRRRLGLVEASLPAPDAADAPRRVLLVEDLEVNARVATKMLERLGCRVEWAPGGAQGIAAAARGGFDLVLLDLRMPDVDGYDVAAAIRRREGDGPRVPVVAMTADVTDDDRRRCVEAGMDDFLGKPVELHRLGECVARWCRRGARPPT